jgi:micrococcal nuclease
MYQYKGTVTNVVDGDTVDATIELGFYVSLKLRFRLYGINAPEMKKDTLEAGKATKARVEELLLNKICTIDTYKPDKYGRWLAVFNVQTPHGMELVNVNQTLVMEKLAVTYMDQPL